MTSITQQNTTNWIPLNKITLEFKKNPKTNQVCLCHLAGIHHYQVVRAKTQKIGFTHVVSSGEPLMPPCNFYI